MRKFKPQPGFVVQAYRYALDPNARQEAALGSHCGAARAAYNWAVGWVEASWWQRRAEETYGTPEKELTAWRPWSLPTLRKRFNEAKHTDPRFAAWWEENSKEAYNTGLANASAAFDNYAKSKNGKRRGKRVGPPRFKSKRKARLACRFTTGTIRVDVDGRHITLPRLGRIRTHEPTCDLLTHVQAGTARILSATVRHERGRWFASFQVEVKRDLERVARPDVAVGIDLGVKTLAVLADSTGEIRTVPNPRHYEAALKLLRRASRTVSRRQGPDRRTGGKPSRRWEKANATRNKIHHRVANLRTDALHKLTTSVAAEYGTIVVEDLHVAGMLRNRRLARRIADAGFGEISRQLDYKTRRRHATRVIVADRWYPSSKTCSGCGAVKAKLPLHMRTYTCDACGLVIDRDDNAALNLAALAANAVTGTGVAGDQDTAPAALKPRGADRKTRTTRTASAGRAGGATLPHQRQTETRDRPHTEALTLW
ncbi:IS607 family element RNA-guided endonuclease TnpB [Streptomyces montanisoli]|uniref:IS607 family element transposase accessory protein TnpB n=1 Tax=Streptomyces montanisoli TaxID=2798581 RepID=A0A940MC42_9ACTN|nr:IS607 family element RNA-guided endonuclease TnpB [Streptomyces montanisoli]MBP0456003.1 IS607 family element transposase accessory protein TnpB [Streptomyces montanisoli]